MAHSSNAVNVLIHDSNGKLLFNRLIFNITLLVLWWSKMIFVLILAAAYFMNGFYYIIHSQDKNVVSVCEKDFIFALLCFDLKGYIYSSI